VIALDPFSGLPEAEELATSIPDLDLYDPEIESLTAEQAIAATLPASDMTASRRLARRAFGAFR